jgi:hypothetical protein
MSGSRERIHSYYDNDTEERKSREFFKYGEFARFINLPPPTHAEIEQLASFAEDLWKTNPQRDELSGELARTYIKPNKRPMHVIAHPGSVVYRAPEEFTQIWINGVEHGKRVTSLGNEFMRPGVYNFTDGLYIDIQKAVARVSRTMVPRIAIGNARTELAYRPASEEDVQKAQNVLLEAVSHEDIGALPLVPSGAQRLGRLLLEALRGASGRPPR